MLGVLGGCNTTKYLEKDQALIKSVKIKGINKKLTEKAEFYIQTDLRKNSKFNLALYNIFNTKKGKYKKADKRRSIGEAPHLVDSTLIELSRNEIEKFLKSKGHFKAKVKAEIKTENKLAEIIFLADSGVSYKIGSISHVISDKEVASLYHANINQFTHVRTGQTYDQDSLVYDRNQVYTLLSRNGYFDYQKSYMRIQVDTTKKPKRADLNILINNPPDQTNYSVYTINESFIAIRNSKGNLKKHTDTVTVNSQYHFTDFSNKYNKKIIGKYLFLKQGEVYNIEKYNLTRDRLYGLNIFRNVKIELKKTTDSSARLNVYYDITPSKKMSNRIEGAFQFNNMSHGLKLANTYANRNLFRGAELFEFKLSYDVQFDASNNQGLFKQLLSRDFNMGVSLSVPSLIPFKFTGLGKNGIPRTLFASNFELFEQRNKFSNQIFTNSMTYNWLENEFKSHSFTPINIEYRIGVYNDEFKNDLIARGYNLLVTTNDRTFINLGSRYTYIYNAAKLKQVGNFFYFKGSLDLSGNTSSLINTIAKFKNKPDNTKTLFGLTYEQYVKPEVDFRFYKFLGNDNQLVFRFNPGIIIPYGNTKQLTFEKCFFGGGSNGMRAWQARTLGPGAYNRSSISPDLRTNLRGLDQIGEIKLEANAEYRFKLITKFLGGKLKGAFFADLGNVWRIKARPDNPNGEFNVNNFLKDIAIGSGFGLRYDVNYFIFRIDLGVKVRDPQFTNGDQWVIRHIFNKEFKENYALNNKPDTYSFFNLNIGIGLPF